MISQKNNVAQNVAAEYKNIEFKIYRDKGDISWRADFIPHPGAEDYVDKLTMKG